jgi:hypothetical protein
MCNDNVVPGFSSYFFNTGKYGCDEVTVEFMYNKSNGICFLFAEVAGKSVMAVAKFFGGFLYFFTGIFIDAGIILQDDMPSFLAIS